MGGFGNIAEPLEGGNLERRDRALLRPYSAFELNRDTGVVAAGYQYFGARVDHRLVEIWSNEDYDMRADVLTS